jgi:hypothetical protein
MYSPVVMPTGKPATKVTGTADPDAAGAAAALVSPNPAVATTQAISAGVSRCFRMFDSSRDTPRYCDEPSCLAVYRPRIIRDACRAGRGVEETMELYVA